MSLAVAPERTRSMAILPALLAVALYLNTLSGPFLNDDVAEIRDNPRVHALSSVPSLFTSDFWGGGEGHNPLYRPLASTTATLVYTAGGGSPVAFHLWNLLLHAGCSALAALVLLEWV